MKIIRLGVDLAKNIFHVHGVDGNDQPIWRKQLKRKDWLHVVINTIDPDCVIGMEACGGAHHWARVLQSYGYTVKLIAPQFVKPYVKSNKNDANDAEAICEAISRPSMRFVTVKTIAQQDAQAIHRIRSGLITERTALANRLRGLVAEYGLIAPKELRSLRSAIPDWLEDGDNGLSDRFRTYLNSLWGDLTQLDDRIGEMDNTITTLANSDPTAKRLQQLRGVGPMIATALIATVGTGKQFKNGRQMSASLGLTPKQHSTGGKERLLGISKRGDRYLRTLLIHGARAMLRTATNKEDHLSRWVTGIAKRKHPNIAVVALANKTTRMAWAMLQSGEDYQPDRTHH